MKCTPKIVDYDIKLKMLILTRQEKSKYHNKFKVKGNPEQQTHCVHHPNISMRNESAPLYKTNIKLFVKVQKLGL